MVIMLVGTLLFMLAPELLLGMFDSSEDGELIALGKSALRTISLCFLPAAAGITLSTVFQAVGKGMYSLIMSLSRQLVVLMPAAWLLSKVSLDAVWWAFPIAEAASLAVCLVLFSRCNRKLLRTLEN
jgi:Na+-driven multidrug efflux pump